jgi:hypothetical protein
MVIVLMVTLWFGLVIEQLQSELTINPEEGQVLREGKRVPLGTIGFEVCVWYEKCMSGVQKKKKRGPFFKLFSAGKIPLEFFLSLQSRKFLWWLDQI